MTDRPLKQARALLHSLLVSDKGNSLPPVRWTRQAVAFVNDLTGRPLRSAGEIARREQGIAEAEAQLKQAGGPRSARREAAPVILYVTDQDHRTPKRIADILKARDIPYQVNDVTTDEASQSWALTQARATEFPLVFVAGEPVGGLEALTQLDVSGGLVKKVFG